MSSVLSLGGGGTEIGAEERALRVMMGVSSRVSPWASPLGEVSGMGLEGRRRGGDGFLGGGDLKSDSPESESDSELEVSEEILADDRGDWTGSGYSTRGGGEGIGESNAILLASGCSSNKLFFFPAAAAAPVVPDPSPT